MAEFPIRAAILEAERDTWQRIARPGTWFDGPTRIAIAAESRHAPGCTLFAERKAALSPYAIDGTHESLDGLPAAMVEIIHRVITDPARLRRQWYDEILAGGLAETAYVEMVGVVASTVAMDTFARAMGLPETSLPEPEPGAPTQSRPAGVKPGDAWVPWVAPDDTTGPEADLYNEGDSNIRRALTSVPDEQRGFFSIVSAFYLSGRETRDFSAEHRAITRSQIELLAGRVSALNECFY